MTEITLQLPTGGWFRPGCGIEPTDKSFVVIIHRAGYRPGIYQYRKADYIYNREDYFLDVNRKWDLDAAGNGDDWEPGILEKQYIEAWKPLGLPEETDRKLAGEIEDWLDEVYSAIPFH